MENEIEQHRKVKTGLYTDGICMCHDCIESTGGKIKVKGAHDSPPSIDQRDSIGVTSATDVSKHS